MPFKSVTQLIRSRAESAGDALACTFLQNGETEAGRLSYADIDLGSRAVAAALQEISSVGDRVLLMYPPGLEFITGFLGCLYAGIVAVPAYAPNPARPERYMQRLSAIAESADARIFLTTSDQASKLPSLIHGLKPFESASIIETDRLEPSLSESWKPVTTRTDSLALLQYTSGSTAEPKGVMVSHGNILHNLKFIYEREANDVNSISVSWLPSFHDMGLLEGILSPIYGAYPLYLMSPLAFVQRPVRWLKAISKFHASNSGGPNFAYEFCTQSVSDEQRLDLDLSNWRVAYNGSEPVHMETMKKFSKAFSPCGFRFSAFSPVYGLAESTALAAATQRGAGPVEMTVNGHQKHTVACGESDKDSQILVVDPHSRLQCNPGEEGEIWLAGPSVAMGYWNDAEQSERIFNAFLADTAQGPFLRSSDMGYLIDNDLYITGRIKDLIILRGRKLFPQDIEFSATRANPLIRNHGVAAFSIEDGHTEHLVILAELDTRRLKKTEIGDAAKSGGSLPDFQRISLDLVETISREHEARVSTALLVPPGQIARTSSGKIQRYTCRDRFLAGTIDFMFRWDTVSKLQPDGSPAG
jgi:acyl-CoA synthetase (AMP-forming)/AMP-acid ligase II